MVESPGVRGLFPPSPLKIMVHKVVARDEEDLQQGEANEPLELIYMDSTHPEATIRTRTIMKGK